MENVHSRREREDYEELDRFFAEADRALEDEDLRGANEQLKRAGVKATSMWGEVCQPTLPGHTRQLIALLWHVQEDLNYPGRNSPETFRKDLRELRSRFEIEARRDAEKVTAGVGLSRAKE